MNTKARLSGNITFGLYAVCTMAHAGIVIVCMFVVANTKEYFAYVMSLKNTETIIGVGGLLLLLLSPIFGLLWAGALVLRRAQHRILLGHCLNCGYSLTGNTSGVCPECGTRVSSAPDAPAR